MKKTFTYALMLWVVLLSCQNSEPSIPKEMPDGKGYFSIRRFLNDYEANNMGQPYMFVELHTESGKTDSTLYAESKLPWATIKNEFAKTDIGYPQFVNQYNFSSFKDNGTHTNNFVYEAKDKTLPTQKLQIAADPGNDKIRFIFIVYQEGNGWKSIHRQLYFSPLKEFSIQTQTRYPFGFTSDTRTVYRYYTQD